jgi:hypothetical protein
MKRIAILGLLGLASCLLPSTKYRSYPPNPNPDIRRVIVLPFFNLTAEPNLDMNEMSNVFASELVKFPGFEVIRPVMVRAALQEGERITTIDDAIKIGRRLKADVILAVAVTDHTPYDPPRTALSVQWILTTSRRLSAGDIDRIIQSASWKGPFGIDRANAGYFLDSYERMWDAHSKNVRDEVRAYADAQADEDKIYRDENEFLAIQDRWMQFVSNQAINLFIQRHAGRER